MMNVLPIIWVRIGRYKICVGQGFPRSGDAAGILVGPISKKQVHRLAPNLHVQLKKKHVYTLLCQASEWGMRSLQGTFPRSKSRLPGDKEKRKNVIQSIVLIHNFRMELVRLNQIKTMFDPEYERCINFRGYNRIKRFYFNEDANDEEIT
jgi:hypothetical protein